MNHGEHGVHGEGKSNFPRDPRVPRVPRGLRFAPAGDLSFRARGMPRARNDKSIRRVLGTKRRVSGELVYVWRPLQGNEW